MCWFEIRQTVWLQVEVAGLDWEQPMQRLTRAANQAGPPLGPWQRERADVDAYAISLVLSGERSATGYSRVPCSRVTFSRTMSRCGARSNSFGSTRLTCSA